MARFLKFTVVTLGGLLLLVLLILWFADLGRFKPRIEAAVTEATGREFRIHGELHIDVLPTPVIRANDVTLANADWADEPEMVQVGHFSTRVDLWSLLARPVQVHELQLRDVTVYLQTNAAGENSWTLEEEVEEEPEDREAAPELPVVLRHADIRNVTLVYATAENGTTTFVLDELVLDQTNGQPDFRATASLDEWPIKVRGAYADPAVELRGNLAEVEFDSTTRFARDSVEFRLSLDTLADIGTLLEIENLPDETLDIQGQLGLDGEQLKLSGVVAEMESLKVRVDGEIDTGASLAKLSVAADGASLQALEKQLPALPFSFESQMELGAERIVLDPLALQFGDSSLNGKLHAEMGDAPDILLAARSPLIDLAPFFPATEQATDGPAPEAETDAGEFVFNEEPLPLDFLRAANADIDISIDMLRMANTEFKNVTVDLQLAGGQLQTESSFNGKYGGSFVNTVNVDAADSGEPVALEVDVAGDALKLVALAGPSVEPAQIPTSAIDVQIQASGNTPRALASSADGHVLFMQGPGRMKNDLISRLTGDIIAQLFNALNPFAEEEEFSNWDCSLFGLDFDSGKGDISSFLLQGEKVTVVGGGTIDLNRETLNIEFNTKPRQGLGVSADMFVTPFVKLSGTLSEPEVGLNKKGTVLSGGAAVLTGGMSFLYQGLVDRVTAHGDKCGDAFETVEQPIPGASS